MADEAFVPASEEWYYPAEEIVKNAHIPDYDAVYQEAMTTEKVHAVGKTWKYESQFKTRLESLPVSK